MFHVYTNWQGGRHVADVQNVTWGGRGGMHLSEFGQNCGYFQLVFVNTSGFLVRPPSDHLSQIRQTDQKDQTSRSVWVWLTSFAKSPLIKQKPISK